MLFLTQNRLNIIVRILSEFGDEPEQAVHNLLKLKSTWTPKTCQSNALKDVIRKITQLRCKKKI